MKPFIGRQLADGVNRDGFAGDEIISNRPNTFENGR
jgi:hypothetical protein